MSVAAAALNETSDQNRTKDSRYYCTPGADRERKLTDTLSAPLAIFPDALWPRTGRVQSENGPAQLDMGD
jgi:hypothetical protein